MDTGEKQLSQVFRQQAPTAGGLFTLADPTAWLYRRGMRGESSATTFEGYQSDSLVRIYLAGRVNAIELAKQLGGAVRPGGAQLLLVDCAEMIDLDPEARQLFIHWNAAHRQDIDAVAVITEHELWHLVVSTMALSSHQKMRAFSSRTAALEWLMAQLHTPTPRWSMRVRKSAAPTT